MAQMVLITDESVRPGMEVGDIVSIPDDDVELSGAGYQTFKIVKVEDYTAKKLREYIEAKIPKKDMAFYLSVGSKWVFERPQEKQVWQDSNGLWYFLEKEPKFQLTAKDLTADDENVLASKLTVESEKQSSLDKILAKVPLQPENLTEAKDLNA